MLPFKELTKTLVTFCGNILYLLLRLFTNIFK